MLNGLGIPVHLFPDPVPTPLLSFSVPHLARGGGRHRHRLATTRPATTATRSTSRAAPSSCPRSTPRSPPASPQPRARARSPGRRPPTPRPRACAASWTSRTRRSRRPTSAGLAARRPPRARTRRPCGSPTPRCTASATGSRSAPSRGPASRASRSSPRRPTRTAPSAPSPSRTPRSRGRWTACSRSAAATRRRARPRQRPRRRPPGRRRPRPSEAATACCPGNEVGVLLGDDAMEHAATGGKPKLVVTTVVSSSLLSRMARDRGVACRETLTGFKWIVDAALAGRAGGPRLRLRLRGGARLHGRLARPRQGRHRRRPAPRRARPLPEEERADAPRPARRAARGPRPLAPGPVVGRAARGRGPRAASTPRWPRCDRARRRGSGRARSSASSTPRPARSACAARRRPSGLPRSDVLAFQSEDGARLTVRPSGTEPKIKFYLELVGEARETARRGPGPREARGRGPGAPRRPRAGAAARLIRGRFGLGRASRRPARREELRREHRRGPMDHDRTID